MRIAWITDPHLNHCSLPAWERLIASVRGCSVEGVLITGDISEGEDVAFQLLRLADAIDRPLYFVLGNHDYYHSSIERTRIEITHAVTKHPLLHYLRNDSVIELSPSVGLIGEDGWGDATEGDFEGSSVRLNDFQLIDDFHLDHCSTWKEKLRLLGKDAAQRLDNKLDEACARYPSVLIATHVPPFRDACWYEGHTTDDHWAPFFVCGQTGRSLLNAAKQYSNATLQVLCGHTHHGGVATLTPNLTVTTGPATYGAPTVTGVILIGENIRLELP